MSHTQEPWMLEPVIDGAIMTADGYAIADMAFEYSSISKPELLENARRIVACVNACAGFSTEVLEATVSEGKGVIRVLQRQRDGLLDAARNLRDVKGRHHSEQAFKALVEAIAKVEAAEHGTNHGSKTA